MKTIYIHIGTVKTGTTSIQNFLAINCRTLLEKNICYPVDINRKYVIWQQHIPLVTAIIGENIPAYENRKKYIGNDVLDEFIFDINKINQDNIIISSEGFSLLFGINHVYLLKKLLNMYKVKIILYIRRQDDFFLSNYQHSIREGRYFKVTVENAINHKGSNYLQMIQNWVKVFGKNNVIIRVFEKEQMYRNDLYSDFMSIIGIDLTKLNVKIPDKLNESISLEKAQYLQKLAKYLTPIDDVGNIKRFDHLEIRNMLIECDLFGSSRNIKSILSYQDKLKIMESYSKENRIIAKKYLGRKNGKLFKEVEFNDDVDKLDNGLSEEFFCAVLVDLLEKLFIMQKKRDEIFFKLMVAIRDNSGMSSDRINKEYSFIVENNLFDKEFYLSMYSDVREAGVDPVMHYIKYGWYEGRNPNGEFSTKDYVIKNITLIDQNINPLVHYKLNSYSIND